MKHTLTFLTALLLAPLALLHAADVPATEPVTIVAFGDSTTAVRGSTKVYTSVLQEELRNVRVINAGVSGNTTEMGRKRFEQDVLLHQPQIAIIQFGINDAAVDVWKTPPAAESRVSLERYEANLRHFVQTLKSKNARVVLMTPNPLRWTPKLKEMYGKPPYQPENVDGFNAPLAPYCEAARRVAREEGAELLDMQQAFVEQTKKRGVTVDSLLSDGMHPNDDGHRIEADLLRERILALAITHGLAITEGPRWKASGEFVTIHPLCTDITHDSPNPTVLGCGLARRKDGAVMTVYSTPTGYYSKPGTTWIAGRVTTDGGKTWSPESVIARHPDCQPSHPSVLTTRDGVLHVFYLGFKQWKWKGVNPTDEAQSDLWTTRSSDNGATWSEPQMIFKGYTGASNGAIETRDGHLIVPYSHYVNDPDRLVSRASVSADGGKTWSLSDDIDIGGAGDHEGALEPCVIELKDGRVWMLIRTSRGVFWESFSTDGGKTWSAAKATTIDATSAPGHLTRLADGRIALVWNRTDKGRAELHLALSADEGKTWTPSLNVARGSPGGATYPFVIEIDPGELWIGYHNVPKGWNFPRARHLRLSVSSFMENVGR
jgi:lysophospholipase L1-like esterase/predicted neuraminidase